MARLNQSLPRNQTDVRSGPFRSSMNATGTVIDLVESDSDDSALRAQWVHKKRALPDDSDDRNRKQICIDLEASGTHFVEAPVKLFATTSDEKDRFNHRDDRSHKSWTQCQTLREMLRFDGNSGQRIEWLVIANYIINFDFLLDSIPELLSVKRVVIFYGVAEGDFDAWKRACPPNHTVDFVALRPSDPAMSSANPLQFCIPYGVHHSKLFLVGYSDGICRVVIHTANLRHGDIHLKAQSAYIQDFPLKRSGDITSCSFEDSLVAYIDSYAFDTPRDWIYQSQPEHFTTALRRYKFSSASVVLLPSIPGYHKLDAAELFGHWKLRKILASCTSEPPSQQSAPPVICQFSSIGSLTEKYLRELQISMDTGLARSFRHQPVDPNLPIRLQLVYPTVDEVRNSIEGYRGGGSVPGSLKNVSKSFLQPLWHRWSGKATGSSTIEQQENPLCKPNNVPHGKSYYQLCVTSDNAMEWFVVTSHNLSKAAWGEVQTSNRFGGRRLFVRHWELGVFLSPITLRVDRLACWNDREPSDATTTKTATVPLSHNLRPEPYQDNDKPWAVDSVYEGADRFGLRSAFDDPVSG